MGELDEACGRAMGWTRETIDMRDYWRVEPNAIMATSEFRPSRDPIAASLLEDEIERRELRERYVAQLIALLPYTKGTYEQCWLVLRATPAQRAQAFLKAVA